MPRPDTLERRTELFRDATAIVEREYASPLSFADVGRRRDVATPTPRVYAETAARHFEPSSPPCA